MTWIKLESPTAKAASQITVTLTEGGSRGKASLNISFPSSLSGTLGFDAEGVERCDVHLGSGILAGKVWVQPVKEGAFSFKRLKFAITVRLPAPAGLPLKGRSQGVDYEKQEAGGFVCALPSWAVAGGEAAKAPEEKPGSLQMYGRGLMYGGTEVMLTESQVLLAKVLIEKFGEQVSRSDAIKAVSVNTDLAERAKTQLDEWVKKLSVTLAEKDIPLRIVTHGRTGFTMRRAVT